MKKRNMIVAVVAACIASVAEAITLVAPVDGAEVPLLKDRQRAFMRMPRDKRAAYFNDKRPDMEKAIKTLRSTPRPVTLEWTGDGGPYKVVVSKRGSGEPWFLTCGTSRSPRHTTGRCAQAASAPRDGSGRRTRRRASSASRGCRTCATSEGA